MQDIILDKKEKDRFKKVSCENILDLALITPNKYENRYINKTILLNQLQVLKSSILSVKRYAKTLQIEIFAHNINKNMHCTIFNFKAYHLSIFKQNAKLYLLAKVFYNNQNILELSQPKIINENDINKIYAKYDKIMVKNLAQKYIKKEYLEQYGLEREVLSNICTIHNPTLDFINTYQKNNTFEKQYLYALKFIEILNYLSKMKNKKKTFLSLNYLNNDISLWVKSLPFKLTDDQSLAIKDIQKDFLSDKSSRRIIVGDVGCGKSMVIFASALIAYPNKSILMAPTTILANQLYSEACKFVGSKLNIHLALSKSKTAPKDTHLIIGTHAILYQKYSNISLIMIDEQHKFGSTQRQLIESFSKQNNKRAHFLQFSATPIPRTMAMIESNLIDMSFIKQLPFKKDISTMQIQKKDFANLLEHIKMQIKENRQIIIVYPLVNESEHIKYSSLEEAKDFWLKKFKNTYITSGQDKNKESILQEFREKGDILLATTLIEVGLSLPKLSTIVIVGADRLGLASLHQLRGRVSRNGLKGYCFLYSNNQSSRLKEFCTMDNGFDIAELDLKYRQSGDIASGVRQSGKMFNFINLSEDIAIIQKAQKLLN